MSLLLIEGWDYLATADIAKRGWTVEGGGSIHASNGRRGTRCLGLTDTSHRILKSLQGNHATLVVGFAYMPTSSNTTQTTVAAFVDGTTLQFSVRQDATTNVLSVHKGATLVAIGTTALTIGVYTYIELKVTFHGSAGAYELRIGGVLELSGSGLSTIQTANAYANVVRFGSSLGSGLRTYYYDDIYVCNSAGSANNDFLGDSRVDMVLPTADGNYTDFSLSTGSDHYANVDEATVDTANYNYSGTVGHRDSFTFAALPTLANSAIHAVQPVAYGLLDIAGTRSVNMMARSGTTDADATAQAMSTTGAYLSGIIEQDPDAVAPWTQSTVNAAEFGVRVAV